MAYSILWRLPDGFKYNLFGKILYGRYPYRVVESGDTVVQIGAPWDILKSGRSRALHFARIVEGNGRVFTVEPLEESNIAMKSMLQKLGLSSMVQIQSGAWSEKTTLVFYSDNENPAANIMETVVASERNDLDRFTKSEVEVDSLSTLLDGHNVSKIKLLSLTTNGAEVEILNGIHPDLLKNISYLSVIDDPKDNKSYKEMGFEFFAEDDRGYLLKNVNA